MPGRVRPRDGVSLHLSAIGRPSAEPASGKSSGRPGPVAKEAAQLIGQASGRDSPRRLPFPPRLKPSIRRSGSGVSEMRPTSLRLGHLSHYLGQTSGKRPRGKVYRNRPHGNAPRRKLGAEIRLTGSASPLLRGSPVETGRGSGWKNTLKINCGPHLRLNRSDPAPEEGPLCGVPAAALNLASAPGSGLSLAPAAALSGVPVAAPAAPLRSAPAAALSLPLRPVLGSRLVPARSPGQENCPGPPGNPHQGWPSTRIDAFRARSLLRAGLTW